MVLCFPYSVSTAPCPNRNKNVTETAKFMNTHVVMEQSAVG
jgi:hypothetical protein